MLLWQANNFFDNHLMCNRIFQPQITEFEIENVLSEVIDIVQLQATPKENKIILHLAEELPIIVYTDQNRLQQILLNLLVNANKFTNGKRISTIPHSWAGLSIEGDVRETIGK